MISKAKKTRETMTLKGETDIKEHCENKGEERPVISVWSELNILPDVCRHRARVVNRGRIPDIDLGLPFGRSRPIPTREATADGC